MARDFDTEYVFRITYADKSALEIYADGRAILVHPTRQSYSVPAVITNRIPELVMQTASRSAANADCEPR